VLEKLVLANNYSYSRNFGHSAKFWKICTHTGVREMITNFYVYLVTTKS